MRPDNQNGTAKAFEFHRCEPQSRARKSPPGRWTYLWHTESKANEPLARKASVGIIAPETSQTNLANSRDRSNFQLCRITKTSVNCFSISMSQMLDMPTQIEAKFDGSGGCDHLLARSAMSGQQSSKPRQKQTRY